MEEKGRHELEEMPFDMRFNLYDGSGRSELCGATGYRVCLGNVDNPADWWNEYVDSEGEIHYGR